VVRLRIISRGCIIGALHGDPEPGILDLLHQSSCYVSSETNPRYCLSDACKLIASARQWFNLMAVRTRRLSLLQHPPLFRRATRNFYLFPAIIFALLIAVFFLYVPKFQTVLGTAVVPVEHWFLPMAFGLGVLLLDEARKWAVRRNPSGWMSRIAW